MNFWKIWYLFLFIGACWVVASASFLFVEALREGQFALRWFYCAFLGLVCLCFAWLRFRAAGEGRPGHGRREEHDPE